MLIGTFLVALTGLLTKFRSRSTNTRRRRRRRRVWRRRRDNYRLRPQMRQSIRRRESSQQASTNGPLPAEPETVNTVAMERIEDVVENGLQADANQSELNRPSPRCESQDIDEPLVSSDEASLGKASSSMTEIDDNVRQPSPTRENMDDSERVPFNDPSLEENRAQEMGSDDGSLLCVLPEEVASRCTGCGDPPVLEGEVKSGSCVVASFKSVNRSEECLQALSAVTADSGYTETSVNSMKSQVCGDASNPEPTHSSRILNINKLQAATCILDFDTPCFCVKELVTDAEDYSPPNQEVFHDDATTEDMPASSIDSDTSEDRDSGVIESSEGVTLDVKSVASDDTSSDPDDETDTNCEEEIYSNNPVFRRVYTDGIVLEEMKRSQDGGAVVGTILVRNDCYEKEVAIRHSSNAWSTFEDTPAQWVESVEGGAFDRFKFSVDLPEGSFYMELAFSFYQKWDNNDGCNYSVSCTIF